MDTDEKARNTEDAAAKRILRYRIVLANIIKYAIPKYSSFELDTIMDMIPASSKTPDGLYVQEDNSEDKEDRKHIDFDLIFPVKEQGMDKVSIWCDIEPQKRYTVKSDNDEQSYDLAARGIYYLARMISRQLSSGSETSGYRHLHKCYGIWICFDHIDDRNWTPSVTRHKIAPVKLTAEDYDPPARESSAADLMELIIARPGGGINGTKSLIGLVNSLWRDTSKLPVYIPENYEGYPVIRKETNDMCDMREVGMERGIEIGIERGINLGRAEGINLGRIESAVKTVKRLMARGFTLTNALELADIDSETYEKYKNAFDENTVVS